MTNAKSTVERIMRPEPIQFGGILASKTRHRPSNLLASDVLDQAFADYVRVDAGTSPIEAPPAAMITSDGTAPSRESNNHWRSATRELIADIATQLKSLDQQRHALARLLESAKADTIAD